MQPDCLYGVSKSPHLDKAITKKEKSWNVYSIKKSNVFCMLSISAVDHCFSNPCRNNRSCINMLDGYHCDCGSDFTGVNCEEGMVHSLLAA